MSIATRRSLIAAGLAAPMAALAQEAPFPSRPITLVIPWPAGGSTDVLGRTVAQFMAADLGQPIVVDNRAGASGTLGHAHVARSRPDGYTMLLGSNSTYAVAPHLMPLPYDNRAAFTGVSLIARSPQALCVNPAIPVNSVVEFIDYAKSKQGDVAFSSAGIGSTSHLATEMFMAKTGARLLHVPYRGGGPSVQGLLTGEVACSFVDLVTALPFRAQRQLKVLGISTTTRAELAMDVPPIAEAGVPGFETSTDVILLLPAGMPPPILTRLTASLNRALGDTELRRRIVGMGIEPIGSTAAELDVYWRRESDKWGEIIRAQNITLG